MKLSERSHSNLYFALFALDRHRQHAFRDVYRFVRAADDVADAVGVPDARKLGQLQSWRQELAAIYDGLYDGRHGPSHPFARQLTNTVRRHRLSREHFETLLDGLERDIVEPRHADTTSLIHYCEAVAASLAQLCLELLGVAAYPGARRYARDVGVALQLANILRDVADDAERGRIYLPLDRLRAHGVSEEALLAGRPGPGLGRVGAELELEARRRIAAGRGALEPEARSHLLLPEIWADVYLALLDELKRINFDVFGRIPYLSRRRKLLLAARRVTAARLGSLARFFPARPRLW